MNRCTRHFLSLISICFFSLSMSWAQVDLFYYLPKEVSYNSEIPTPKSILGHEVGEWHVSHDKLVYFFYNLAGYSSRVKVEKYGQTYEYRPLLNVIITSEENHKKLEQIRQTHLMLSDPINSEKVDIHNLPVIIRLGYSIHGNEASGANASILLAYYLAAAQGKEIDELLDKCIILIDPSLNPDGLQRFSTWVNEHKSKNLNADPNNREFDEAWPGGRTNHYWFDLNRDWLLAQQPESIGRLKLFHDWMPNIQTDHHEMGSDATFFFQPGVPARKHPLISEDNAVLTEKIGAYHAKALDKEKRLYFTKESFDDFYFGKGSTYPDLHGGIGILFEQASARGHLKETQNGELSFPFAIKNHFISSLSTISAGYDLRLELLEYQRDFYKTAITKNKVDLGKAIILGANDDPSRLILLGQVLLQHHIKLYETTKDVELNHIKFNAGKSIIIPLNQSQNKLIRAIFERQTTFKDSLFYDISAWNFDLSFNTDLAWINDINSMKILGDQITELTLPKGNLTSRSTYAYAINWDQYFAPGAVNGLLQKGLILKVATDPFSTQEGEMYDRGTILIPIGIQNMGEDELFELLGKYASNYHLKINAISSGLSTSGIDLGSSSFSNLRKPTIAMLVGDGVNEYDAGEIWHLLDQRMDMHITMIPSVSVDRIKFNRYNVLILPDGSYGDLNSTGQEKIKEWVKNGGTLVASCNALRLISKLQLADLKFKKAVKDTSRIIAYADQQKAKGAQQIGGAIFTMEIDNTHPLAYGYHQKTIPVMKNSILSLESAANKNTNPFRYAKDPLLSGYTSIENLKQIGGSPAVSVAKFGEGKVIAFVDDYNFRAFWYGTNRLFINSIFFGNLIVI